MSDGSNPAQITCLGTFDSDGFAAGESRVMEITAKAPSAAAVAADSSESCFQNTAHVYGNEKDTNSDNDEATTPQTCLASQLSITKKADSIWTDGPDANGVYTAHYTVKVTNNGSVPATYTRVTDSPDMTNVDIKSITWSGGPDNAGTTAATLESMYVPTWTISSTVTKTLAAGATDTYKVTVNFTLASGVDITSIKPCVATSTGYTGGFVNTANVSGAETTGNENVACVQPKIPIGVHKLGRNCDTDKKTCPLTGAHFALYDTDPTALGSTPIAPGLVTDSNGYFQTEPLKPGTDYWLVETQSPEGHELMATPIHFRITANKDASGNDVYAISLLNADSLGSGDTAAVSVTSDCALELDVYDPTTGALPVAGGTGIQAPWILIGFALALIFIGITEMNRRRKQNRYLDHKE